MSDGGEVRFTGRQGRHLSSGFEHCDGDSWSGVVGHDGSCVVMVLRCRSQGQEGRCWQGG